MLFRLENNVCLSGPLLQRFSTISILANAILQWLFGFSRNLLKTSNIDHLSTHTDGDGNTVPGFVALSCQHRIARDSTTFTWIHHRVDFVLYSRIGF